METPIPQPSRLDRVRELVVDMFWLVLIAFVGLYVSLLVLGGFSPVEAGVATLVAGTAAVLLGAHFWHMHRHAGDVLHDPRIKAARERRGF